MKPNLITKLAEWKVTRSVSTATEICDELCNMYFEEGSKDNENLN